jgi:hypothetical protein
MAADWPQAEGTNAMATLIARFANKFAVVVLLCRVVTIDKGERW